MGKPVRHVNILTVADAVAVIAFAITYARYKSLVPLYIGLMPLILCNFIYSREFLSRKPDATDQASPPKIAPRRNFLPLLIMPLSFCFAIRALITFDSSLGWSPVVSIGFSLLLCLVIIASYGAIKGAIAGTKS
jgi:hypothetical protein